MVDRRPDSTVSEVTYKEVLDSRDPGVAAFSALMRSTFADPNLILSSAAIARLIDEREEGGRRLHLLLAVQGDAVLGGTMFSYIPATNCGFSEYIVISPAQRRTGLARGLFNARQSVLEADASAFGHDGVYGLFVEVANPYRVSPQFKDAERRHGVDTDRRWQIMHHFGFRRLEMSYAPPPTPPGDEVVTYLDLLFRPMHPDALAVRALPAEQIVATLGPVWRGWTRDYAVHLARLAERLGGREVPLADMLVPPADPA